MVQYFQIKKLVVENKVGGKFGNHSKNVLTRYAILIQKRKIKRRFMPKRQRIENIFDWS